MHLRSGLGAVARQEVVREELRADGVEKHGREQLGLRDLVQHAGAVGRQRRHQRAGQGRGLRHHRRLRHGPCHRHHVQLVLLHHRRHLFEFV